VEPWPRIRDIEWFDEKGKTMRPEDWQFAEGRLLCVRRAVRLEDERTEISVLLINNTGDQHRFALPQPSLPWVARIDSADPQRLECDLDAQSVEVEARSVQLLTALLAAQPPQPIVHGEEEERAPEPEAAG
jgi:glycogen operon protein